MLLWPSPHERLPLFPRYCRANCSRFVFRNATVNLPKQAFFVTVAGCKDGVLPYWCCGCVGLAVCRNAAVAFLMLRLLSPSPMLLPRQCRCCLVNTKLPFAIVDLWLPSPQLLFYCHVCFNCGCWCCCLTAVASPILLLFFEHFY
jgi:hypothetical protein